MTIDTRPEGAVDPDAVRLLRKANLVAAVNPDTMVAALFASDLRLSDPDPVTVADAVVTTVIRLTTAGCADVMAEALSSHSDPALERMHWVRSRIAAVLPALRAA